jgi:hypothetical protein
MTAKQHFSLTLVRNGAVSYCCSAVPVIWLSLIIAPDSFKIAEPLRELSRFVGSYTFNCAAQINSSVQPLVSM